MLPCFSAGLLALAGSAASALGQVSLLAAGGEPQSTLVLRHAPLAEVVERRTAPLPAGTCQLLLDWGAARLNPESLSLAPLSPGLQVGPLSFPADRPSTAVWRIEAADAGPGEFELRYLIDGLTWETLHTVTLHEDVAVFDLVTTAIIRNDSGQCFDQVAIDLGLPEAAVAELGPGDTIQVPYLSVRAAQYEPRRVYDPALGASVVRQLVTDNAPERGLGESVIPAGKARIFRAASTQETAAAAGQGAFIGETTVPETQLGEELKLQLGTAEEVEVERRKLLSREVDQKLDVYGRTALYNVEEEIGVLIRNRTEQAAVLHVVDAIDGQWEMKSTTHEYERQDAGTVQFIVAIGPHEETELRYRYKRLNITP